MELSNNVSSIRDENKNGNIMGYMSSIELHFDN